MDTPGALFNASRMSPMFWSSMRWRVMTETACGISRSDWSPLAMVTTVEA